MDKYCLVVDRGTTNIKTALYGMAGDEIAVFTQPSQRPYSRQPGFQEQDMDLIWEHVKTALVGVLAKADVAAEQVAAVSVTGQGDGLYAIDRLGRPVRPGILSIDRRTETWFDCRFPPDVQNKIKTVARGRCPGPVSAIAELRWLKEFEPDNYRKTDRFFASKDWVRYKLTGEAATDITEISSSGLADLVRREYITETFSLMHMEDALDMRPPLVESCATAGYVTPCAAKETGLIAGTPVITGATDMCMAPFGAGGGRPGHFTTVMGTWAFNYTFSAQWDIAGCPVLASHVPGKWLAWTSSGCMAASVDWYLRLLCAHDFEAAKKTNESVFTVIENKISSIAPTEVWIQPYLFGGATDYSNVTTGGILNLKPNTHTYEIVRALYQSVAYAQCVSILDLANRYPIHELWAVGGVSNSSVLCQIMADILDTPVNIPMFSEAACRGAARCAAYSIGQSELFPKESSDRAKKTYVPDRNASFYREQFSRFVEEMERQNLRSK